VAVTRAAFLVRFPIFASADNDLLDAEIAAALIECNALIWGSRRDDGVMHLVAHRTAMKLPAQFSQLVANGTTTFFTEFRRMQKSLLVGDRCP
jgi:hypothetical protein